MTSQTTKKKIMLLMGDLGGGTGNHLFEMLSCWDHNIWSPSIISTRSSSSRVPCTAPIEVLKKSPFDHFPAAQIHQFIQVLKTVRNQQPVLVHSYFFWPIIYGRLLKKLGKIPVLVENREDQGFSWGPHEYAWLYATRHQPDCIICVSEAVKHTVCKREKLPQDKVLVIHNGIAGYNKDTAAAATLRSSLGLSDDHKVVGMVANLNRKVKGIDLFVESLPLIINEIPTARFLILGRGQLESALKERAEQLGISSHLIFCGFQKEVAPYYSLFDISVLTSKSEGCSMSILESMSYGLPVVATDVGGNHELIIDGETGFLTPPADKLAFAESVCRLLFSPELANRMGRAAQTRARSYFNIHNISSRYLALYQELLSSKGEKL